MFSFMLAVSLMTMKALLNLSAPSLSSTEGTVMEATVVLRESASWVRSVRPRGVTCSVT